MIKIEQNKIYRMNFVQSGIFGAHFSGMKLLFNLYKVMEVPVIFCYQDKNGMKYNLSNHGEFKDIKTYGVFTGKVLSFYEDSKNYHVIIFYDDENLKLLSTIDM
jgi:hypothetical protein